MTRHTRQLLVSLAAMVTGAGLALAVAEGAPAGAEAADPTASIRAVDFAFENAADPGSNAATISVGGTVTFSYPDGGNFHNVDFSGIQPTSCTQTAGVNPGPVPPLPATPEPQGWAGQCRFDTPGTYAFVCDAHAFMTGSINVVSGSTTTGTTTGPPGTTPTTPAPPPRVNVRRRQRGTVVRGSVTAPAGPSQIVVTASVSSKALGSQRRPARQVRVGSQRKRSTGTGRTSFAVKLNAAARRALRRRARLTVKVRIAVTPPAGDAVTRTVTVVLRKR